MQQLTKPVMQREEETVVQPLSTEKLQPEASTCCSTQVQDTCCEPSEKAECCNSSSSEDTASNSCGCQ